MNQWLLLLLSERRRDARRRGNRRSIHKRRVNTDDVRSSHVLSQNDENYPFLLKIIIIVKKPRKLSKRDIGMKMLTF